MNKTPDQNSRGDKLSETTNSFFRCPVASENAKAVIRIGRRQTPAEVQETSIDGFTVLVSPENASKLKVGRPWVMHYDGTCVEVHPQWMFNSPDGHVQLGLRRLRDLTRPVKATVSNPRRHRVLSQHDASNSTVAFGGFVLCLFVAMALPGLGDRLGTSDGIQTTVRWIVGEINATLSQYL